MVVRALLWPQTVYQDVLAPVRQENGTIAEEIIRTYHWHFGTTNIPSLPNMGHLEDRTFDPPFPSENRMTTWTTEFDGITYEELGAPQGITAAKKEMKNAGLIAQLLQFLLERADDGSIMFG